MTHVAGLQPQLKDNTDRNRTSPLCATGNSRVPHALLQELSDCT